MVTIAWTSLKEADPNTQYLVFAGLGERKSAWTYLSYLMRARKVEQQLRTTKGLLGYTARLTFAGREIVNVTVWDNEAALEEFAHHGQHVDCMANSKAGLKPTTYVRWSIAGSQLPPTIEEAYLRGKNKI
jgi:hypothetical protein